MDLSQKNVTKIHRSGWFLVFIFLPALLGYSVLLAKIFEFGFKLLNSLCVLFCKLSESIFLKMLGNDDDKESRAYADEDANGNGHIRVLHQVKQNFLDPYNGRRVSGGAT